MVITPTNIQPPHTQTCIPTSFYLLTTQVLSNDTASGTLTFPIPILFHYFTPHTPCSTAHAWPVESLIQTTNATVKHTDNSAAGEMLGFGGGSDNDEDKEEDDTIG